MSVRLLDFFYVLYVFCAVRRVVRWFFIWFCFDGGALRCDTSLIGEGADNNLKADVFYFSRILWSGCDDIRCHGISQMYPTTMVMCVICECNGVHAVSEVLVEVKLSIWGWFLIFWKFGDVLLLEKFSLLFSVFSVFVHINGVKRTKGVYRELCGFRTVKLLSATLAGMMSIAKALNCDNCK